FCSPQYELSALGRALVQRFPGVTLIGCTTAGEISQRGLTSNSITAFSLPKSHFAVDALLIEDLRASGSESLESALSEKLQLLSTRAVAMSPRQTFAFALLDGMSVQEEVILSSIARSLGSVPLIGGSAGDGLKYDDTFVFSDGRFHNHAGVVLLVNTRCRFEVLSGHHFEASTEKMVVTRADPTNRTVYEINAEPAAPEYCRIMGLTLDDLKEGAFAKHPVGVQVGENLYVRSIRQLNDDLSLTFFCAIDSGVVLTRLLDQGLLDHFSRMVGLAKQNIGDVQLIVGCDCIHRLVEAEQKGLAQDLSVLYQKHRVLGFNTYGEQFGGLHLNHTFTGLAIGTPAY
ncbi:MAG: FIST N-terminal domain-containing protein, partial [Pseudomonadota bacterium]